MKHSREIPRFLAVTLALPLILPSRGGPTAAELLRRAAANLSTTTAVHFTVTAHTVTPGFRLGALASGTGTLIWPDYLVFDGSMQSTPVLTAPIVMVACGQGKYVELGDGTFQPMQGLPDIKRLLFAPDSGLMTGLLTGLESPSTPRATMLDTASTWYLSGILPDRVLAMLPGHPPTGTHGGPVHAALWIGQKDLRLRQVTFTGPVFAGDSAGTVRTLTFSRFNERVPLAVPRGTAPACPGQP